jgi:hypothetical protein
MQSGQVLHRDRFRRAPNDCVPLSQIFEGRYAQQR